MATQTRSRRRSPRFPAAHVCFLPVATRQPRRRSNATCSTLRSATTPSTSSSCRRRRRCSRTSAAGLHLEVEAALATGVPHTVLWPTSSSSCWRRPARRGAGRKRRLRARFRHRATAALDYRDVAAVAAALLACDDVTPHDGHLPADRTGSGDAGRRSRAKALADAAGLSPSRPAAPRRSSTPAGPAAAGGGEPVGFLEVLADAAARRRRTSRRWRAAADAAGDLRRRAARARLFGRWVTE